MSENASIQITISGDALEFLKQSDPSALMPRLERAMDRVNQETVGYIQEAFLSFPSDGPTQAEGLRRQSGRFRDSLRANKTTFTGTSMVSSIGTNVVSKGGVSYPAVHEFGCFVPSRPTRSQNKSYAKKHPVTKAYSLPARAPIQTGIKESLDLYTAAFEKTILNPQ